MTPQDRSTPPPEIGPPVSEPNDEAEAAEPDPHAELLARLRARNAASEANYRVKSGELP
ncbi:hypothetical protein [Streptomyces sp. NBRC 109706]|uniref:hypothetical protein n=1 Tax=Streptomyces sp. NBRC 109706 TaxID=1550035 RepID=UPI000A3E20EC|nr:hypothetical protein [Streptomyces sp. NBRC 109706]